MLLGDLMAVDFSDLERTLDKIQEMIRESRAKREPAISKLSQQIKDFTDELGYMDDLIVRIRYKYDADKEYTYSNELLLFNSETLSHEWWNDWDEGQQDIELVAVIPIDHIRNFDKYYLEEEANGNK